MLSNIFNEGSDDGLLRGAVEMSFRWGAVHGQSPVSSEPPVLCLMADCTRCFAAQCRISHVGRSQRLLTLTIATDLFQEIHHWLFEGCGPVRAANTQGVGDRVVFSLRRITGGSLRASDHTKRLLVSLFCTCEQRGCYIKLLQPDSSNGRNGLLRKTTSLSRRNASLDYLLYPYHRLLLLLDALSYRPAQLRRCLRSPSRPRSRLL